MRKKNAEKTVEPIVVKTSPVNKQFTDAINLINCYNQILSDNTFEQFLTNETVISELTEFVEERLGSLVNIGKTETFDSVEVRMLKNLLKKVGEPPTKTVNNTNFEKQVPQLVTPEIVKSLSQQNFEVQAPTQIQNVPLATTQDNLDPIVKEALQAQEQELVQLPRKHKTVDRSPTQVITTPDDINNYARAQAAAANKTRNGVVDVRKLL